MRATLHQAVSFIPYQAGSPLRFTSLSFNAGTGLFSGAFSEYVFDIDGRLLNTTSGPFQGIATRGDATATTGYAAGYFTRTRTFYAYDYSNPDVPRVIQHFPLLLSGSVHIQAP